MNRRPRTDQPHEMCGPHARGQSFATDITEREYYSAVRMPDGEKITGQMAHGKNLTGNFKVAVTDQARGTKPAVHLSRFEDRRVQLRIILLQCGKFHFQLLPL